MMMMIMLIMIIRNDADDDDEWWQWILTMMVIKKIIYTKKDHITFKNKLTSYWYKGENVLRIKEQVRRTSYHTFLDKQI